MLCRSVYVCVWLCVTAAVVSVSERSPHSRSGGRQPDSDERWPEWTEHYTSRQERRSHEPRHGQTAQTIHCHLVTTGGVTAETSVIIFDRVLSTQVMEDGAVEFLALKLISGQYAYSMEATCPKGE